jgi:hypothetical protein
MPKVLSYIILKLDLFLYVLALMPVSLELYCSHLEASKIMAVDETTTSLI